MYTSTNIHIYARICVRISSYTERQVEIIYIYGNRTIFDFPKSSFLGKKIRFQRSVDRQRRKSSFLLSSRRMPAQGESHPLGHQLKIQGRLLLLMQNNLSSVKPTHPLSLRSSTRAGNFLDRDLEFLKKGLMVIVVVWHNSYRKEKSPYEFLVFFFFFFLYFFFYFFIFFYRPQSYLEG